MPGILGAEQSAPPIIVEIDLQLHASIFLRTVRN
jgi:hypothetical protein